MTNTGSQENRIFFETPNFLVTERDLALYLSAGGSGNADLTTKSREAIHSGLNDLYALNVLASEARDIDGLVSAEELEWIGRFAKINELVKRVLQLRLQSEMESIDLHQLAREYYVANPKEFLLPESVTVRTLLIRADCLSIEEARERATTLMTGVTSEQDFIRVIEEYTEDKAAKGTGGLLVVRPGETVQPFEEAAFSLATPGQISDPVISEFGIHVIQLIERHPAEKISFEAALPTLLPRIEETTKNAVLDGLRLYGKTHRPEGLVVHQDEIDTFMREVSQ